MKEVSVIVLTYNSVWEKLKATIQSILLQKNVDYEIIFADDGSSQNWAEKIIEFLEEKDVAYQFSFLKENAGTVKNIAAGLKKANGKYIKLITPGDFFYVPDTLSRWIAFMETRQGEVSFADAVYYASSEEGFIQIQATPAPANRHLFDPPQSRENVFVSYLLANDTALGASLLMRADLMQKYIDLFADRVKYAEDYMLRLIVFDNVTVHYFHEKAIWYEYGTGISTCSENLWTKRLHEDFETTDKIIKFRNTAPDQIAKKYLELLKKDSENPVVHKIKKLLYFPTMTTWRKQMQAAGKTPADGDLDYLRRLFL